tara:strand:- start:455 stop:706 length:252 start_codon:yes stop_codon:yes gene_type:complete
MERFAEVEENKVTILCNGVGKGNKIDLKTTYEQLEKLTLEVNEAKTKKQKIEAIIELQKSKALLNGLMYKLLEFTHALVTYKS